MQGASESTTNPSNVQGVCPKGWHVPSKAEWLQLANAINNKGGDLKDTKLWQSPNTGATNIYGFNALGGGNYEEPGFGFHKLNQHGFWWTTQSENGSSAKRVVFILSYDYDQLTRSEGNQDLKASCRCVKD